MHWLNQFNKLFRSILKLAWLFWQGLEVSCQTLKPSCRISIEPALTLSLRAYLMCLLQSRVFTLEDSNLQQGFSNVQKPSLPVETAYWLPWFLPQIDPYNMPITKLFPKKLWLFTILELATAELYKAEMASCLTD